MECLHPWRHSIGIDWRYRCDRISGAQIIGPARPFQVRKPLAARAKCARALMDREEICGIGGVDAMPTLRDLCGSKVPSHVLDRAEEAGLRFPTQVQMEALPVALEGRDCILHAQTGSGKTLAYMLPILSKISCQRSAVQAIVVVPTRELGIQVAQVARLLGGGVVLEETDEIDTTKRTSVSVMTLLDGGTSSRQKKWLRAAPPQLVIGTLFTVCRMIETGNLKLNAVSTIVVDEVDTAVHKGTQILVSNLLTKYSFAEKRQTIFASATVPQHNRFIHDCVQNKWTKPKIAHIYVRPEVKMPSNLSHRYVICGNEDKLSVLHATIMADAPKAAFVFANEQSEKGKREGLVPRTRAMLDFFEHKKEEMPESEASQWELLILEECMNIHARFANSRKLKDSKFLLFATDLAARGLDVPEVTHVYNLELPSSTVAYIHRAGRTARKPLEDEQCVVTTLVSEREEFVIRKLENEIDCNFELVK
ncbi:DEAD-box ATP-dependent RNA helicase 58, chloroplastic [Selaginella moellendorffii]|uniref:DEAD-box ATP-dependent RNA helicase 58, chloroplastic n=1 Tax=Selaginella moellendorffii TaxID=88036 RepID=UPI000D1CC1AB|nr:DEAD-box ATP-dependent RNA helicase 58, chloroplastic [Selaginella moellendorffii]|eukprot:XP_024534047.1 DEAD-box ATP-dependent RNA helicase 58, chloroplastic [Selaginella moellendorffii]